MVGIPLLSGFISKLLFAQAAAQNNISKMLPTLICLAISTILNAIYFLKTVIRIYTPVKESDVRITTIEQSKYTVVLTCMVIVNLILGCFSQPIVDWIEMGLRMFG